MRRRAAVVVLLIIGACGSSEEHELCDREDLLSQLSDYVSSGLEAIDSDRYAQFHLSEHDRSEWYESIGEHLVDCHVLSVVDGPQEKELTELYATFEHLRGHFAYKLDRTDEVEVDTFGEIADRQLRDMQELIALLKAG